MALFCWLLGGVLHGGHEGIRFVVHGRRRLTDSSRI